MVKELCKFSAGGPFVPAVNVSQVGWFSSYCSHKMYIFTPNNFQNYRIVFCFIGIPPPPLPLHLGVINLEYLVMIITLCGFHWPNLMHWNYSDQFRPVTSLLHFNVFNKRFHLWYLRCMVSRLLYKPPSGICLLESMEYVYWRVWNTGNVIRESLVQVIHFHMIHVPTPIMKPCNLIPLLILR